ncbi:MAG: transposase [bacterium]
MARIKRVILPNYPHHIIQRGHNRQVIFAQNADFKKYIENIQELKIKFGIKVFAYCLMTNHIHLLLQPGEDASKLPMFMKTLAGRTTRYFNLLEGRSGTLWESRYKSSPVQKDLYLLACCRYIELNPVRAGITTDPATYPWSSYIMRMGGDDNEKEWLDLDPMFLSLGETKTHRREKYQTLIHENATPEEFKLIRESVRRGQLTGNSRFEDIVEQIIKRRIERRKQGRPFRN